MGLKYQADIFRRKCNQALCFCLSRRQMLWRLILRSEFIGVVYVAYIVREPLLQFVILAESF